MRYVRSLFPALSVGLLLLLCAAAGAAPPFDSALRDGHFAEASAQLSQFPPGGSDRGEAIEKALAVLPLLQWSPETETAWTNCLTAIETETNAYWATRNLGGLLGALAAPSVPHNTAVAAMLDRAVAASRHWAGQGAPLVVAKGLLWYGDFDRAFAPYPVHETPEPLVEFAFETLADKPELAKQNALWEMALNRRGSDPMANRKAVQALAFTGKMSGALAIGLLSRNSVEQVGDEILAARYARYGSHEADFVKMMGYAAGDLKLLSPTASSLPMLRDLLEETDAPPIPTLPDEFWKTVEAWATTLPPDQSHAAVAEIAGASAWAGRADASSLLPTLAGTPWQDSARMRVACGWLWNGRREQAAQCAAAIQDPEWRTLAEGEMAYLTHQLAAGETAK